jgi:hypothetical protein
LLPCRGIGIECDGMRLGWLRKYLRFSKSAKNLRRKFLRKMQLVERVVCCLVTQKIRKNKMSCF